MKAKTAEGRRLKRLVTAYANAVADRSWMGSYPAEEHDEIKARLAKARKRLFAAIDEVTSVDLTPREIGDCRP